MKKRLFVMLAVLYALAIFAPQAKAQAQPFRQPPNYMAAVDGYAPADYDGDGKVDFAIKDFSGAWTIDYAANGLGAYDVTYYGYGGQDHIPVPADYDGDGIADLSVKNAQGIWNIDYAYNGFGAWDTSYGGYGNAANRPVPADYDGDGKADLSVKSSTSLNWLIDYASNGFGVWDVSYGGYGGAENIPVPADYDGDGKADLAVWIESGVNAGYFDVDYASNGFGRWDYGRRIYSGPGRPVAGDFNADYRADISVKRDDGSWIIDYSCSNPFLYPTCFTQGLGNIDATYYGYGGSLNRPVAANYDGDTVTDLAIRSETDPPGFSIDYGFNGFGSYDASYFPY